MRLPGIRSCPSGLWVREGGQGVGSMGSFTSTVPSPPPREGGKPVSGLPRINPRRHRCMVGGSLGAQLGAQGAESIHRDPGVSQRKGFPAQHPTQRRPCAAPGRDLRGQAVSWAHLESSLIFEVTPDTDSPKVARGFLSCIALEHPRVRSPTRCLKQSCRQQGEKLRMGLGCRRDSENGAKVKWPKNGVQVRLSENGVQGRRSENGAKARWPRSGLRGRRAQSCQSSLPTNRL